MADLVCNSPSKQGFFTKACGTCRDTLNQWCGRAVFNTDMLPCCIHESTAEHSLITDIVSGSLGCDVIHTMCAVHQFHQLVPCQSVLIQSFHFRFGGRCPAADSGLYLVCRQRKKNVWQRNFGRVADIGLKIVRT